MDEALLSRIAAQARVVRVSRRKVVYRKGDACEGFYIVAYGRVRLSLFSSKGMEKPIQIANPGGSIGEAAMFREIPHHSTAIAVEDCALVFVPKACVVDFLQADWRLGMRMLANLSCRMHSMGVDIDDFLSQPPAGRVASYLLRLIPAHSMDAGDIRLALHKHLVAAQLNLQPETLSRYFRDFCNRGLIKLERNCVTIFNVDRLAQFVADENARGVGRAAVALSL
ncbi:MAG TPA: Crp/Fnr family transcriptional regulator [Variovorax sp.]|nr:Crp/Fnr family transcriptional regulator [Variovorax sp.]